MKKNIALIMALMIALCLVGCSSKNDVPTLEDVRTYTVEDLEIYMRGLSREQFIEAWGEPDGQGSGFWLDYWHLDDVNTIAIYYDADGKVETAKITDTHFNKTDSVNDNNGNVEAVDEVADE